MSGYPQAISQFLCPFTLVQFTLPHLAAARFVALCFLVREIGNRLYDLTLLFSEYWLPFLCAYVGLLRLGSVRSE